MNLIPSAFTERGFSHREIERKGEWRLFERKGQGSSHFEVVRIRIRKERETFGKIIPAHEFYPPSESWGIDGFTLNSLDSARRKLETVSGQPNAIKTPRIP
jgi:hypothetical protein